MSINKSSMLAVAPHAKVGAFFDLFGMLSTVSYTLEGDTAVIPIKGPLYEDVYEQIVKAAKSAEQDEEVKSIRFDVSSPGGVVDGVIQAARDIKTLSKPTKTRIKGMSCSAAYLLTAATDKIEAYPTSQIGSIGAIFMTTSEEGSPIRKFVSSISPNKQADPDSEIGISQYQALVDEVGEAFVSELASFKGITREDILENYGKGLVFGAKKALEVGMIDKILAIEPVKGEEDMPEEEKELPEEEVKPEEEESEEAEAACKPKKKVEAAEEDMPEEEEESPEDIIKRKDDEIKRLKEELDKLKKEDEPEEEEAKAESPEVLELREQIEQLRKKEEEANLKAEQAKYEKERDSIITNLMASGHITPAEKGLAINAYDGEQKGEHKLFTEYFASRKPVVPMNRVSHNASTEDEAMAHHNDDLNKRVINYCKLNGLDPKTEYYKAYTQLTNNR